MIGMMTEGLAYAELHLWGGMLMCKDCWAQRVMVSPRKASNSRSSSIRPGTGSLLHRFWKLHQEQLVCHTDVHDTNQQLLVSWTHHRDSSPQNEEYIVLLSPVVLFVYLERSPLSLQCHRTRWHFACGAKSAQKNSMWKTHQQDLN